MGQALTDPWGGSVPEALSTPLGGHEERRPGRHVPRPVDVLFVQGYLLPRTFLATTTRMISLVPS